MIPMEERDGSLGILQDEEKSIQQLQELRIAKHSRPEDVRSH